MPSTLHFLDIRHLGQSKRAMALLGVVSVRVGAESQVELDSLYFIIAAECSHLATVIHLTLPSRFTQNRTIK